MYLLLDTHDFIVRSKAIGFIFLPLSLSTIEPYDGICDTQEGPNIDPFDRILISQAEENGMVLLTHDSRFKEYNSPNVRIV